MLIEDHSHAWFRKYARKNIIVVINEERNEKKTPPRKKLLNNLTNANGN